MAKTVSVVEDLRAARALVRRVDRYGIFCAAGCWATIGPCESGCGGENCDVPARKTEYWNAYRAIQTAQEAAHEQ